MLGPRLQSSWDWRAAGNFIFGGTGAGLMVIAALLMFSGHTSTKFGIVASLFIAAGLGLVSFEIGRPLRSLNVFKNPYTSWMTREGAFAFLVIPMGLLASLTGSFVIMAVAALLAFAFLYAQARILRASKGIPAWRTRRIELLILSTGLVEGTGFLLLANALLNSDTAKSMPLFSLAGILILIAIRFVAWLHYYMQLSKKAPERTIKALASVNIPFIIFGGIVPFITTVVVITGNQYTLILMLVTGICMLLSGWLCKYVIIIRAAYSQGYAIPYSPARGGGTAGPGTQPGWKL